LKITRYVALCLWSLHAAFAQAPATLAAIGYSTPAAPLPVAPGQVVTLFLRGVGPLFDGQLRSGQAASVPLPTTLAGLSARIADLQVSVPIFAVRQENDCLPGEAANPACLLTSIRVQMPFELGLEAGLERELVLEVDGQSSRSFPLNVVSDNSHVITSCDATWDTNWASSCSRLIFHPDGTPVSEKAPATRGETLVLYVWGLGRTSPAVPTGELSPAGTKLLEAPAIRAVRARFLNSLLTSLTATPRAYSAEDANDPGSPIAFSGLAPGQVGLYQVNVPVPQSLQPAASCGNEILANAVLHITTYFGGTEEMGFCMRP